MTWIESARRPSGLIVSAIATTALLVACGGGEVRSADSVAVEPTPAEQSAAGAGAVNPPTPDSTLTTTGRTGGHDRGDIATLLAVRTSAPSTEGVERVVFEFDGDSVPRYEISYLAPPYVQCGSGRPIEVAGEAVLQIRLRATRAYAETADEFVPTVTERDRKLGQPLLSQLTLNCDFEGEVEWLAGLASRIPFRIMELESPARLVVDLWPMQ